MLFEAPFHLLASRKHGFSFWSTRRQWHATSPQPDCSRDQALLMGGCVSFLIKFALTESLSAVFDASRLPSQSQKRKGANGPLPSPQRCGLLDAVRDRPIDEASTRIGIRRIKPVLEVQRATGSRERRVLVGKVLTAQAEAPVFHTGIGDVAVVGVVL